MKWRHQPESLVTTNVPWPPLYPPPSLKHTPCKIPPACRVSPLPLHESALPPPHIPHPHRPRTSVAARLSYDMALPDTVPKSQLGPKLCPTKPNTGLLGVAAQTKASHASDLATEFLVTKKDLAPIYMSPCPYFDAFEEEINLQKFNLDKHRTAGLGLALVDGRLFLIGMAPGTPGAKIPHRRTRIKGTWLIKVGDTPVSTINEVHLAFYHIQQNNTSQCILLFSHPEI